MKRLSVLTFFVCIAAWAGAQVFFQETTHDFGTFPEGEKKTHVFTFRNTGAQPVTLTSVKASCGCTTPQWTRTAVEPNGTGSIEVTYNSERRPGPFTKTITVKHDADEKPILLTIRGKAEPSETEQSDANYPHRSSELAFDQLYYNLPEKFSSAATAQAVFKVKNMAENSVEFALEDVEAPAYMQLSADPRRLEPGQTGVLTVTLIGEKAKEVLTHEQYFTEQLHVHTAGANTGHHTLRVSGTFERNYSPDELADQPTIVFVETAFDGGEILAGEILEHQYAFQNTGKAALRITSVKASCGCTASKPNKEEFAPGEAGYITASFNSRGRGGKQLKTITVETNDPKNPRVVLKLQTDVKQDPLSGGGAPVLGGGGF